MTRLLLLAGVLCAGTAMAQPKIEVITGHRGYAARSQFVPHSNLLVTTGTDKIIVWDISTSNAIKEFPYAQTGSTVSDDGKLLAFATLRNTIEIWTLSDMTLLRAFPASHATELHFSPDSQRIFFLRCDDSYEKCSQLSCTDITTGSVLFDKPLNADIASLLPADDNLLVGIKNRIIILDRAGNTVRSLSVSGMNVIQLGDVGKKGSVAVYSDAQFNPSVANKGTVLTVDLASGKVLERTAIRFLDFYRDIFPVNHSIEATRAFIAKRAVADDLEEWYKVDEIRTEVSPLRDRLALNLERRIGVSFFQDAPLLFTMDDNKPIRSLGTFAAGKSLLTYDKFLVVADEGRILCWDLLKMLPLWESPAEECDIDTLDALVYIRRKTKNVSGEIAVTPLEDFHATKVPLDAFRFQKLKCGPGRQLVGGGGDSMTVVTGDKFQITTAASTGKATYMHQFAWSTGKRLLSVHAGIGYRVQLDYLDGKPAAVLAEQKEPVTSVQVSPDGRTGGWVGNYNKMVLYDLDAKKKIAEYTTADKEEVIRYAFMSNDRVAVVRDLTLQELDFRTGQVINQLKLDEPMSDVVFNKHLNRLLLLAYTGKIFLVDPATLKTSVTMMAAAAADYWAFTPDGYYKGSRNCSRAVVIREDGKVINGSVTEQTYYRPDLVLKAAGIAPDSYLHIYRRIYDRPRPPASALTIATNLNDLPLSTPDSVFTLKVKCTGAGKKKLHITSNDIPIYGDSGLPIGDSVALRVPLFPGENFFTCDCRSDAQGVSRQEGFRIYSGHPASGGGIYYVGLAAANFRNAGKNLKYAKKDIRDMGRTLRMLAEFRHLKFHMDTLFNDDLTPEALRTIGNKLRKTTMNDLVIIHYSGHGLLDDDLSFYFSTPRTDFGHVSSGSIPYDQVAGLLDSVPAMRRLMLIDACNSGEEQNAIVVKSGLSVKGDAKGDVVRRIPQDNYYLEFVKEYYSNRVASTGSFILAATTKQSLAYESDKWNNGIFTYSLLLGLKNKATDVNGDRVISISELRDYVNRKVFEETDFRQKPSTKSENLINDFPVRIY